MNKPSWEEIIHERIENKYKNKIQHLSQNNYRTRFLINKGNKYQILHSYDIACFIYQYKATYAITHDKASFIVNNTLESIEKDVNPTMFFRANRQIIINIEAFDYFEVHFAGKLVVKLKNNLTEPFYISKHKASLFKEWLDG